MRENRDILYECPFCGKKTSVPTVGYGQDIVVDYTVLSIECPCGATFALTRGGRPHARSD